ncbi:hypothetical protein CYMTET_35864 [Cymbomonas tetramitiformis]|uniref:PUA domain-containing protein n=1 Tax=Cymbomonas tetramitiformis TaxID=36881 RepID=A0AAE0F8F2_9CHLO|nr:hypothetical protein CYMTET_35864 [Cymbomonas tetramitiformis]
MQVCRGTISSVGKVFKAGLVTSKVQPAFSQDHRRLIWPELSRPRRRNVHFKTQLTISNQAARGAVNENGKASRGTRGGRNGGRDFTPREKRSNDTPRQIDSSTAQVDSELRRVSAALQTSSGQGPALIVLKRGKAPIFRDGQPLVYGGAVASIEGHEPELGESVLVTDGAKNVLGWGVYNATSMYRVRIMQRAEEIGGRLSRGEPSLALDLPGLVQERIKAAAELRGALDLPREDTTAYRLVNSEGDRLSGLIVDRYGDLVVVQASAAWVELCARDALLSPPVSFGVTIAPSAD